MGNYEKVALVTGSSKRIGKQIIETLHSNGFKTIVHYNNSEHAALQLVTELNAKKPNSALAIKANLTNWNDLTTIGEKAISCFGRVDLVVNNASSFYPTPVSEVSEDIWNDLMGTNLKAPYFIIQQLKEELDARNGNVINIVDIHAKRPLRGYSIYCMAKAGLSMLTKSLSQELAPRIRVNGIAPGAILWHDHDLTEQDKENVLSEILLNRLGTPKDIAKAVLYLNDADYVTGQIIAVDGGRSVQGGEKA